MEQNNIIVIGGNHHNTLGIIRSLGYKGLRPYVILITNKNKLYICYSKYIKQYKCLSSPNEIVNHLLEIKDDFKNHLFVITNLSFLALCSPLLHSSGQTLTSSFIRDRISILSLTAT